MFLKLQATMKKKYLTLEGTLDEETYKNDDATGRNASRMRMMMMITTNKQGHIILLIRYKNNNSYNHYDICELIALIHL